MTGSIPINAVAVPDVLKNLRDGEWLVPPFQREFVWDVPAITALATSIIDGYPIGMMTLWDQSEEDSDDHLEAISLPDWDPENSKQIKRLFTQKKGNTPKAILDGRQRSTALAILFDNFRQLQSTRKYAGRFFLDVTATEPSERIVFKKTRDLEKNSLTSDKACIGAGLFPLSPSNGKHITEQWMDYIESIRDPSIYPENALPPTEELDRRRKILRDAYKGIFHSHVAVYTVPSDFDLGRICDIFETLNQTGVKVSTVDLIHSWILTETTKDGDPLSIRDWMEEASELEGALGWISSEKRPELTAQIVTACYVARSDKPEPPRKTKGVRREIHSVKSPDLLNTPKAHWREIVQSQKYLIEYIRDFQSVIGGGAFSATNCPYPASAAIYVALRWHLKFDHLNGEASWSRPELDALYKAFFWHNALSGRYDQGFLTQIGSDIRFLKNALQSRAEFTSLSLWVDTANKALKHHMDKELPTEERLTETLLNGRPGGALQAAVQLLMIAGCRHDIGGIDLEQGKPLNIQLHHIFPKKWCSNNAAGRFSELLDPKKGPIDYVNSVANLMPLSPEINRKWRDMSPGTFITNENISYDAVSIAMEASTISKIAFDLMASDLNGVEQFWKIRAKDHASKLLRLTNVRL